MSNIKGLSTDPRFRSIVQKHLRALSDEIAHELTQPFLEQWGLTRDDLAEPPDITTNEPPEPIVPAALIYDPVTRRWRCPRCRRFSDTRRRSVTAHLRFCKTDPAPLPPRAKQKRKNRRQPKKKS